MAADCHPTFLDFLISKGCTPQTDAYALAPPMSEAGRPNLPRPGPSFVDRYHYLRSRQVPCDDSRFLRLCLTTPHPPMAIIKDLVEVRSAPLPSVDVLGKHVFSRLSPAALIELLVFLRDHGSANLSSLYKTVRFTL